MMDLDIRDWTRLIVGFGLSTAIFMGFWVVWLKTRERAYRSFAYIVGSLPATFVVLVLVGRYMFATGTIHQYETYVQGAGKEAVVREVAFPVMDAELRHEISIEPAVEVLGVVASSTVPVEIQSAAKAGGLQVEFDARGEGSYLLRMRVPVGVAQVKVVAKEIR